MKKLRFLLVVPVAALAWLGTAAFGPAPTANAQPTGPASATRAQGRIANISWQGNTFLSAAQLSEALGLRPGDPYDKAAVAARLAYRPDGGDVTSRYMDQGYLFFSVNPVAKTRPNGATDLTFVLSEGPVVRIGALSVRGNQRVATADVLRRVVLHPGEVFSRAKLVESQQALAQSGLFVPNKIGVNPQPLPDQGLVNVEFVVVEK